MAIARLALLMAALFGASAVGLGAYAAHGLKGSLETGLMQVLQTAIQYQFYHALALLAVALLARKKADIWLVIACMGFVLGVLGFSGSLYLLLFSSLSAGIITPLGGLAMIVGWLALAVHAFGGFLGEQDATTD